jgi:hypothetical protein
MTQKTIYVYKSISTYLDCGPFAYKLGMKVGWENPEPIVIV